jgi:AcrR family transcriptional regulator
VAVGGTAVAVGGTGVAVGGTGVGVGGERVGDGAAVGGATDRAVGGAAGVALTTPVTARAVAATSGWPGVAGPAGEQAVAAAASRTAATSHPLESVVSVSTVSRDAKRRSSPPDHRDGPLTGALNTVILAAVVTQTERLREASRRRRDTQKQELRQAILAAAGELILEKGYEAFSLRQVAERIGYSATTIYLYFENKDALVAAVIEEGFGRFLRALEAVRTEHPGARISALGRAYVRFARANPVYYRLMFMNRPDLVALAAQGEPGKFDASFQVLQRAVQGAIDAGAIRPGDARGYSFVLWSLVHGIASLAITGMVSLDEAALGDATDLALGIVGRGLATS